MEEIPMKKITILILTLLFLVGCSNQKINTRSSQKFISNDELSENLTIESAVSNNKLILFITNNNTEIVDTEIKVEFYDQDDKKVSTEEDIYSAILDKKEIAVVFDIFKNYDYFKVFIETTKSSFKSYEDKITILEQNDTENFNMKFKITNNAEEDIDYLELAIIYYKDDKIVGVESEYKSNIKKGKDITFNLSYPYNSKFELIEYNNFKIYVNEACTYKKDSE